MAQTPFTQADKERLDVLAGVRGTGQDRAVRLRELSNLAGQVSTIEGVASAPVKFEDVQGTIAESQLVSTEVYNLLKAAGLAPVEVLDALPTTGNFVGRTVYLTTDQQLYRWNGTAWTAAVPAVNVTGQITQTQIADEAINTAKFAAGIAPVEIVTTLPTTGNFAGRTVFLTTDTKLYRHTGSPTGSAGFTKATDGADIVANSITAGQIATGAISTDELAAGAVTTEKLAVGSTNNVIHNSQFFGGLSGWTALAAGGNTGVMSLRSGTSWTKPGATVLQVYQPDAGTAGYVDVRTSRVGETGARAIGWPVKAGDVWEASAGISAHRCTVQLRIEWRDVSGTVLSYTASASNAGVQGSSTDPDLWGRLVTRGTAPTGAAYATIHLRKLPTSSGSDSYMMVHKPLLGTTVANAADPLPWSPGGYSLITGDTILTGSIVAANIAAGTITADEIKAGTITSDRLDVNAVTAGVIAAGAISGDLGHIASLSVDTLQIKGQAVTVPVRVLRGNRVGLTTTSWVRVASLSIPRAQGFQTLLKGAFAYDGAGTQAVRMRILRASTQIWTGAVTTGPNGAQMQASIIAMDANTAAGATQYHLEVARGSLSGKTFQANVWAVFLEAEQVLR